MLAQHEDKAVSVMKVGHQSTVSQGPVTDGAITAVEDGTDGGFQDLVRRDESLQVKLQGKPQRVGLAAEAERERQKGGLFLHPLPIAGKSIGIPVAGGRKVEFPVARRIPRGEEEFETGMLPEAGFAGRSIRGCRYCELRHMAPEIVMEDQSMRLPGDAAGDFHTGRRTGGREWLQRKAPLVHLRSPMMA
jgi:hypothetical protein